jgi:NaMN:DMB phosphoribosyltransferase
MSCAENPLLKSGGRSCGGIPSVPAREKKQAASICFGDSGFVGKTAALAVLKSLMFKEWNGR